MINTIRIVKQKDCKTKETDLCINFILVKYFYEISISFSLASHSSEFAYEYKLGTKLVSNYHSDVIFELLLPRFYVYTNVQNIYSNS